jgi:hypothetical protein
MPQRAPGTDIRAALHQAHPDVAPIIERGAWPAMEADEDFFGEAGPKADAWLLLGKAAIVADMLGRLSVTHSGHPFRRRVAKVRGCNSIAQIGVAEANILAAYVICFTLSDFQAC